LILYGVSGLGFGVAAGLAAPNGFVEGDAAGFLSRSTSGFRYRAGKSPFEMP
jgi:hypothetical protein